MTAVANLLDAPSTALTPEGLYALVFQAGIGPVFADEDVYSTLEGNGDISCLPPIAKQGAIWGIAVKVRQPSAHGTIGAAFTSWTSGVVVGFAEAALTLIAVVKIGAPTDVQDVTLAVSQSDLNPGTLGIGTSVSKALNAAGSALSAGVRDLIIALLIVLAIIVAVKFLPRATKA